MEDEEIDVQDMQESSAVRPCQINLSLLGRPRWKGRAGR